MYASMKIELPLVIKATIGCGCQCHMQLLYTLFPGSSMFQYLHTVEPGMKVIFLFPIDVKLNNNVGGIIKCMHS